MRQDTMFANGVAADGRLPLVGQIASIEPRTLTQGPGVRFVVYLRGCRLRCPHCPCAAIDSAFSSRIVGIPSLVGQIRTFLEFMTLSGGGVTVAGGDPLHQSGFVIQLFRRCRALGLSTVLNTRGIGNIFAARGLLCLTDLVVLDITGGCRTAGTAGTEIDTGRFSRLVGNFAAALWLRYVVIPGVNDGRDAVDERIGFAQSLDEVERVEILTVSQVRDATLGDHCPSGAPAPADADPALLDAIRRRFRAAGLYAV